MDSKHNAANWLGKSHILMHEITLWSSIKSNQEEKKRKRFLFIYFRSTQYIATVTVVTHTEPHSEAATKYW